MTHILTILSLIVAYFLYKSPCPEGYEFMYLHSLVFAIGFETSPLLRKHMLSRVSIAVLLIVGFFRYVITPFVFMLGGFPRLWIYDVASLQTGMILMCYEEVVFFLIIIICGTRLIKNSNTNTLIPIRGYSSNLFSLAVIVAAIAIILLFPQIYLRYHFTFGLVGDEYELLDKTGKSSFLTLLGFVTNAARYILILIVMSICLKRYRKNTNFIYIVIPLLIVLINSMVIYDISRFSILVPAITLGYLLYQLFPSHRKIVLRLCFFLGLLLLYISTDVKMFSEARGGNEGSDDITAWASILQAYFMGYRDVGLGVYVAEQIKDDGLMFFLNDVGSNVMVVSRYTQPQLSILHIYNEVYSGGVSMDKIPPNICASYAYFGFFLSPLITAFFTRLAIWFDERGQYSKHVEFKFLYIYSALMCSFVMMQFYTMIISTLVNTIFVLYLFFMMNRLFAGKKE